MEAGQVGTAGAVTMGGLLIGEGDLGPPGKALPHCPDCGPGFVLSRSQPDPNEPGRLLGVCDGCGKWFQVSGVSGTVTRLVEG